MTPMRNGALGAPPNVLRDQIAPNTLGGMGSPGPAVRLRLPIGWLAAIAAVSLAVLAVLLGRAG